MPYLCSLVNDFINKAIVQERNRNMSMSGDNDAASRERKIYQVTIVGSVVNFLLLLFKFFAGIAGHSAAMIADAVHSLSDFVTDIIVLVFVRISSKPEDEARGRGARLRARQV